MSNVASSASSNTIEFSPASAEQVDAVYEFLKPFMKAEFLLSRSKAEILKLLANAFVATLNDSIVGFGAVEVYSQKLAEIQCLAVSPEVRRQGVGRTIVRFCVESAREHGVKELMAISASDQMFVACGFDYSLPNQKRALFISPQEFSPPEMGESEDSQD